MAYESPDNPGKVICFPWSDVDVYRAQRIEICRDYAEDDLEKSYYAPFTHIGDIIDGEFVPC